MLTWPGYKSHIWKHVTQGQKVGTWEKMHGDHTLRCNYCKAVFQGNQSKAARHFTQPKRCKQASMSVLVDIWNKTDYKFDDRHEGGIRQYMEEQGIVDARSLPERGTQTRQAGGGGRSHRDEDIMNQSAVDEVEAFLDRQARREADAMQRTGGGCRNAEKRERGRGKRGVDEVDDDIPAQGRKRPRQMTIDEVYDGDAQQRARSTFLQWVYDAGIPFRAFWRSSWRRHRKAVAKLPRGVRMVYPSFKEIGGSGVIEERNAVASMLAHVRASFMAIGAIILTVGRKSRDLRPIINFLVAGKHGALLHATACRDASVPETGEIVLRRWKAIFRSFPPSDVLAICTDSASNYMSAAKLLAKDADLELRRITWLPGATHVCNLMVSDIGTRVDCIASAILRGRALVRFIKMHNAALYLFRSKTFTKLAQLVEIATNLKLLECSESSAGYVIPWGHLDALDEVRAGATESGSAGPVDEEPEPLVWGARPRASGTEEELTAIRHRLQQLGSRRPRLVSEVFAARAAVLLPYEGDTPEEEVVDDAAGPMRDDAVDDDEDWTDPEEITCRADTSGDHDNAEVVTGPDAALQPSGDTTHHATLSPSLAVTGHADVPPVSASPPAPCGSRSVPCGSPASQAPLTLGAGGSCTMDSESDVVRDVVLGLMAAAGAEVEQVFSHEEHGVDTRATQCLEADGADTEEPHRVPIHVQPVEGEVPVSDTRQGDEESRGHGAQGEPREDLHTVRSLSDTQVVRGGEGGTRGSVARQCRHPYWPRRMCWCL
ncbi:hypothetical protein CBR_g34087 [Chara braunii]|uniref:DUF659 domain-containing protein n=1 Tax=Chara braunii TaxID=69332 RepID=A0A388LHV2_CHABU|nr:hypothetical protein CBR_g34087 [Chara braunii]|eukprot:GBG81904.1 hypothetical protein CBR_g34087 [Chara braunii]